MAGVGGRKKVVFIEKFLYCSHPKTGRIVCTPTSPDLELPGGSGESKKSRTSSKSEPDTPTPSVPSATPDYAAGLGVEFPPATPTSSRAAGSGDTTGGVAAVQTSGKKGALELALQSPTTLSSDSQKPQVSFIKPRRACAARVTVVGSVCLSVCLSVHASTHLSIVSSSHK